LETAVTEEDGFDLQRKGKQKKKRLSGQNSRASEAVLKELLDRSGREKGRLRIEYTGSAATRKKKPRSTRAGNGSFQKNIRRGEAEGEKEIRAGNEKEKHHRA